jgi:glycosyltransferase involved in cell wall biosynthesis
MKQKILFVSTSSTVGGAEKTLYTLATLLNPEKVEIVGIVTLKPKGHFAHKLEAAGVPVFSLNVKTSAGLQDLQKLAVIIHETKPDIVHAIMYQAIQLSRAVRKLGYAEFKLVSSPRVNYRTRGTLSLWIDGYLKSADDLLIAECESSRKYLLEKLGYEESKTATIHNGVDIAGWPISKKDREKRRKELRLEEKDILIGTVGRLDEQKGQHYLLEAIAKLKASHPIKCAVIGEGPLLPHLTQRVRQLGLEEDVFLLGHKDNIPSWLSAFDIFVLPSLWEGIPNALLEAMALGLPIVATNVDGVPEAVNHDISGVLCAPKDPQAMVVPLQDLIVDEEYRQRLGESAKLVVNEHFKLVDMLEKYESAYDKIAGNEPDI